jgi:hypothetical protein
MITPDELAPGDVVCVRTNGFIGFLIRVGAALRSRPNLQNHIAIVHHRDEAGTLWGIEGRPGGVGWIDMTAYLQSRWTLSNSAQPKTDAQRSLVCTRMVQLLGVAYDYEAIGKDVADDLGLGYLWHLKENGKVPAHLVCSALAADGYDSAKLLRPVGDVREVQPADWTEFVVEEPWK